MSFDESVRLEDAFMLEKIIETRCAEGLLGVKETSSIILDVCAQLVAMIEGNDAKRDGSKFVGNAHNVS